ncbi:MAG: hypothetical protein AAGU27_15300 [Dehalobacterium sp.]
MEKDALTKKQEEYLEKMAKHLPVLRASIRMTQKELAKKIGVTRQSMMNMKPGVVQYNDRLIWRSCWYSSSLRTHEYY